jgi:hypothetical protein
MLCDMSIKLFDALERYSLRSGIYFFQAKESADARIKTTGIE